MNIPNLSNKGNLGLMPQEIQDNYSEKVNTVSMSVYIAFRQSQDELKLQQQH